MCSGGAQAVLRRCSGGAQAMLRNAHPQLMLAHP